MTPSLRFLPVAALATLSVLGAAVGCEQQTAPPPQPPQPQYAQYPTYPPPYPTYPPQPTYTAPPPQPTYTAPPQPTYTAPPQPTYTAPPQPTYTAPPQPTAPPTPSTTSSSPFPFPIPTFPTPAPAPSGAAGPSATPIDPSLATVATLPLQNYAQTEAPGMNREGPILAGQFQEGQILEQTIQLLPGKCYTILAVGAGIQEVDITLLLLAPLPGQPPVLARDTGSGSQASLGGRGNCYRWQLPVGVNAKWVLKATKGAGIAAGALYVK